MSIVAGLFEIPDDSVLHGSCQLSIGEGLVAAVVVCTPTNVLVLARVPQLDRAFLQFADHAHVESEFHKPPNFVDCVQGDAYMEVPVTAPTRTLRALNMQEACTDRASVRWFQRVLSGVDMTTAGVHKYYKTRNLDKTRIGLRLVFQRSESYLKRCCSHVADSSDDDRLGKPSPCDECDAQRKLPDASPEGLAYFLANQRSEATEATEATEAAEATETADSVDTTNVEEIPMTPEATLADVSGESTTHRPMSDVLDWVLGELPAGVCLKWGEGCTLEHAIVQTIHFPAWIHQLIDAYRFMGGHGDIQSLPYINDITPGLVVLEVYKDSTGTNRVSTADGKLLCPLEARRLLCCHAAVCLVEVSAHMGRAVAVRCEGLDLCAPTKSFIPSPMFGLTNYCLEQMTYELSTASNSSSNSNHPTTSNTPTLIPPEVPLYEYKPEHPPPPHFLSESLLEELLCAVGGK